MRVCAVSFKECWQDESGAWWSYGGFPFQMAAIASLFDAMTLVICRGEARTGGSPLPRHANVVALRLPVGVDLRRKLSVVTHLLYYLRRIARAVREADAVHVPGPGDIPLLGMLIAVAMKKRLLVRYCTSWLPTSETTIMNRVTRWLIRRLAGGRNVMLATGERPAPPAPGVSWIFATALSSAELEQTKPSLDRGLTSPPRLLYAGRLSPEKGVANLVRAAAQLAREGFSPLPTIIVAGDGPQRRELEQLVAALDCGRMVRFVGQLNRPSLADEMRRSDLCVQPSLTEGFSKAWLDAFAHGLPVLSSDVGAARAVIGTQGERGWLVPAGDIAALVAALRAVLTDRTEWRPMRERCRAYVEGRTLEAWANEIGQRCAGQWRVALVHGKLVI